jgi:N,N-dimethylformamidase beta subunit-like protein
VIRRRSLLATTLASVGAALPWLSQNRAQAASEARSDDSREPTQESLWRSDYLSTRVWGYVDKHSIRPGESFKVMLSAGPGLASIKGTIRVFRVGYSPKGNRELVWESEELTVEFAGPLQVTSAILGAAWPEAQDVDETEEWRPGYYTIDFVDSVELRPDLNVAFIVVTDHSRTGDVLVLLGTNTYQAYNAWGGSSLYECAFTGSAAQMVSFDRPTPPNFFAVDAYLVNWLETLAADRGFKVGYASNFDIHREPGFAFNYKQLISSSHNEYWSKEEFDAIHRRIFELGKNTMFLGANAAYWQVRYADLNRAPGDENRGRQLVCYKGDDDPVNGRLSEAAAVDLMTMRFRDYARRPETMLMGSAYQSYFDDFSPNNRFSYKVTRTDLPFFEGTGYEVGQSIGDLVGYEWDNRDPEGDGHRLWDAEKSRIPSIPADSIKVLFTGSPIDLNKKPGIAEAVYFVSKAGAKVFNAGSIWWCWGLGKEGYASEPFKRFNENMVLAFLA